MYNRNMRNFAVISVLLLAMIAFGVIFFAQDKEKIYVSLESYAKTTEDSNIVMVQKEILNIKTTELEEFNLLIPLMPETTDEDIFVENEYQAHTIYITINTIPEEYYESNFITAEEGYIAESYCEYRAEQAVLEICLNDMYDNQIVHKNGTLQISFYKPKEFYDKVILINIPEETEEKRIILSDVARRVQSLFSNSDTKVYLVGNDDEVITNEERLEFVAELDPDLVISLGLSEEETGLEEGIVAFYNEEYFIPFFGNEQLADYIEYYTLKETRAKVLGIAPIEENSFIDELQVPSAQINIGYFTNSKEKELLKSEEYINKIVLGIYNGLVKSCENLKTIEEK